jgi:hypothetical protein
MYRVQEHVLAQLPEVLLPRGRIYKVSLCHCCQRGRVTNKNQQTQMLIHIERGSLLCTLKGGELVHIERGINLA